MKNFIMLFFNRPIPLIILQFIIILWGVNSIFSKFQTMPILNFDSFTVWVITMWMWLQRVVFNLGSLYMILFKKKYAYWVGGVWVIFHLLIVFGANAHFHTDNPNELIIYNLISEILRLLLVLWGLWYFVSKKVRVFFRTA